MAAGSIIVDLLMRTGSFETDTERARKSLEKFKREAVDTASRVGELLGVSLTVAGLTAIVKSAIDAADSLNDLSQTTGIAVETLGGLGFAASQAGGSLDSVADAAGKLNKTLAAAAAGEKEAVELFRTLGVAVTDAAGATRKADAVMADIADRFSEWEDGPEKAALALKAFGKAGADQIALLNGGGQALREQIAYYERYAGITAETARQADEFNDTLGKIGLVGRSFANTLAAELLPALQAVAEGFLRLKEQGSGFGGVAAVVRTTFETLAVLGANTAFVLSGVGREIGAIGAQIAALARGDLRGFRTISDAVREDAARARAELDAFERRVLRLDQQSPVPFRPSQNYGPGAGNLRQAPRLPGGGAAGGGRAAAARAMPLTYEQEIGQAVGRAIEASDVVRARELTDQIAFLDKLYFEAGLSAEVYESAMKRLTGQTDKGKDATSRFIEEQKRLDELLSQTATSKLEAQRDDMLLLTKAFEEGRISVLQYTEAVQSRLGNIGEATKDAKSFAEEFGLTFTSALEDAIARGKGLRDMLQGIGQDLLRITTRKLITEPLGDMISGALKGSGIGSFLGSLFGGPKAAGGPVSGGTAYLVGERGPELFVPRTAGSIVPNDRLRSAGAAPGWSPVINVYMPAGSTAETANQAGARIAQRLRAAALRTA